MRLPIIPVAVAVVLMGAAAAFLTRPGPTTRVLDAPSVSQVADLDGIETEVAISPDGTRYAVIASDDLWLTGPNGETPTRLTMTPEPELAPSWTPDGTTITFTRGNDTLAIDPPTRTESIYLEDATHLTSSGDHDSFVRGRALWVADRSGAERELIAADPDDRVSIRSVRISPDQRRFLYVKSIQGLRGQVWVAPLTGAPPRALVADRVAENPTSAEWIDDGRIVYLTDRAGGLAVWYIVLEDNSMVPLTAPLMERSLAPLALDTYGQRTIVPRHVVDSDIQSSSGTVLVNSAQLEYAPAISTRGDRIAYTVAHDGVTEIWVADADGSNPKYLARGQYPRFAPNGNEIVYSNTDLDGNRDIWKADLRTGLQVRLTDDAGMDDTPDWAPDGRSIVFSSERGGQNSLWTIPPDGGQRLKLGGEAGLHGYAPRFSADGARIAYWDRGQVWSARADGTGAVAVAQVAIPTFSGWSGTVLAFVSQGRIMGAGGVETFDSPDRVWGGFDLLPDGSWLVSTVRIERTELLAIDLTFTDQ